MLGPILIGRHAAWIQTPELRNGTSTRRRAALNWRRDGGARILGAVGDRRATENDFDLIGVASTRGGPRPATLLAILQVLLISTMDKLPPSSHGKPVDAFREARALESELRKSVRGEIRFDAGSRALYSTDSSNYRQIPIGLVVPRDADDVISTVEAARKFGAPVLPRGAGTSLAGQCCNVAVVLDFSKYMNNVLEFDPDERSARVEPGVVLERLAQPGRNASAHLRARPCDAQPLHPGRHDREQLLWYALDHGRKDCRQRRGTRHPAI